MITEETARSFLTKEQVEWLAKHKFKWTTDLPLSKEPGWTNNRCSFIFQEGKGLTETVSEMNYRLELSK